MSDETMTQQSWQEQPVQDDEEEEYDDTLHNVGENDEEQCPQCEWTALGPFTYGRQHVVRCKNKACGAYLCPRCLSVLSTEPSKQPGEKVLRCPHGHLF